MSENPSDETPLISAAMIRAARGLVNLSQTDFGDLVGVSRRTISKIETEAEGRPDSRRREILAKIRTILEDEKFIEFVFADGEIEEGVLKKKSTRA